MPAAQRSISGTVTDNRREPLTGATILVKEIAGLGAVTDAEGRYELRLPDKKEYTLTATHIGYFDATRTLTADTEAALDFQLKENPTILEQVVVTGTRTPKLLKDVPIVTRVITESDIRRTDATNIGDLLQTELPGIEFSYSMNQQTSLNMAGFGGNSVLFLVDGERLAGETLDNVDYSRLNMDNVKRIEIVKGAASSLYGSNAVGGVVNIISRESQEPWSVNVNGRYGAHNEQRYGGSVGFNRGRFNSMTNVQYTSIDAIDLSKGTDNAQGRRLQHHLRTLHAQCQGASDIHRRGGTEIYGAGRLFLPRTQLLGKPPGPLPQLHGRTERKLHRHGQGRSGTFVLVRPVRQERLPRGRQPRRARLQQRAAHAPHALQPYLRGQAHPDRPAATICAIT